VAFPGSGSAAESDPCLEIVASPRTGHGPLLVRLEPKVRHLREPLQFQWYFGDGQESAEAVPEPHNYAFGKYNLVLKVVDGEGRVCTAGVYIESAWPG
jgi:hypothetical protein